MSKKSVGVAILNTHGEAENAVKELQRSGFELKKFSIVGMDQPNVARAGGERLFNLSLEL